MQCTAKTSVCSTARAVSPPTIFELALLVPLIVKSGVMCLDYDSDPHVWMHAGVTT